MNKITKPLLALDLDGVLALENRDKYYEAKAEGTSALRHYYTNLKPNTQLIEELININTMFEYKIFTARKNDLSDIKEITVDWVWKYCRHLNGDAWPPRVVHTRFRWKAPEVYFWGAKALIDNDIVNLSRVPFVKRYAYDPYNLYPEIYGKQMLETEWWQFIETKQLVNRLVKDFYAN